MDSYKIKINTFGHKGRGIGEIDGKKIFVPKVGKGDICNVSIREEKKYFAFGRLERIEFPSPLRIQPACSMFHTCGGCDYQFLTYQDELKIKEDILRNQLKRIGKINFEEHIDVIPSPKPEYYRNKAKFNYKNGTFGFYDVDYNIIEIPMCRILDKKILKGYEFLRSAVSSPDSNNLAYAVIRSSRIEEKTLLHLVSYPKSKLALDKNVVDTLGEQFSSITLSEASLHDENIATPYASYGTNQLIESIDPIHYLITPTSFFQVNPYTTQLLYTHLQTIIEHNAVVFDLYTGSGAIALYSARSVKEVIGVDISRDNILLAERTKELNSIENASFYTGKSERYLKKLLARHTRCDSLILDPPRKGCERELIEQLLEFRIRKIIYISCNPATLARDLAALTTKYTIEKITLFDMFPRTYHMEVVVNLKIKT